MAAAGLWSALYVFGFGAARGGFHPSQSARPRFRAISERAIFERSCRNVSTVRTKQVHASVLPRSAGFWVKQGLLCPRPETPERGPWVRPGDFTICNCRRYNTPMRKICNLLCISYEYSTARKPNHKLWNLTAGPTCHARPRQKALPSSSQHEKHRGPSGRASFAVSASAQPWAPEASLAFRHFREDLAIIGVPRPNALTSGDQHDSVKQLIKHNPNSALGVLRPPSP